MSQNGMQSVKNTLRLGMSVICMAILTGPAALAAEPYPVKPVRLVVGYAAGNITDVVARVIAPKISERWKQAVVIENRPGQGGSIAAQQASKAEPDGYTLVFSALAAFAVNPHLYANVGYSALKDFVPIVMVGTTKGGIVFVHPGFKATSVKELVAYSKANPLAVNYGSPGSGTLAHFNVETLKDMTGLEATHIPHKGAAQLMNEVLAGRIQLGYDPSATAALPHIQAGKLRAVATFTRARLPELPNVPTIFEQVPGFEPVRAWLGVMAPAGIAPVLVDQIYKDVVAVLRQPDIVDKLNAQSIEVLGLPPAEFRKVLANDYQRMGKLVHQLKLTPD
jgi:tripartite-type tricarboxylate transporter receptor subunit TctC